MQEFVRSAARRLSCAVIAYLPERRILIESDGGQRLVRIGTREQLMGLASAAMIAGWLTVSSLNGAEAERDAERRTEMELARMAAQVQALRADTAALKGNVATTAERIEARQQFLDALLTGRSRGAELAGLLPRKGARAAVSAEAAASAGVLAPFAALEEKQLALVDRAAATAETRLRDAEALIGRLGLSPSRFVAQSTPGLAALGRLGLGGPFIPATNADAAGTDPRFAELFVNWQRVEQMEVAMEALPAFVPARNYTLTSGYGFRYDPFSGAGAQHFGIDLAGAHGEPIYAAAAGRVVRAERFGGYGLAVDIDHGRGILTRYGHLSRIDVRMGQKVRMGQTIGGMGSTGRSTGTHLHYEVRIDGRPVNPRPFIDSSRYLLAFHDSKVGPTLPDAE
jgi:murein DD-endopeptidase MepM/ murein hydrolase activator NlpD